MSRSPLLLLLVLVGMLHAPLARASDEVVIQFVPFDGVLPSLVCVASPKPSTGHVARGAGKPAMPGESASHVFGAATKTAEGVSVWRFKRGGAAAAESSDASVAARAALERAPDSDVYFSSNDACAPELVLTAPDDVVYCVQNPMARSDAQDVAVILLDYGTAPARTINFISVRGDLVNVYFLPARSDNASISGKIAGGHYREMNSEPLTGRIAQLALKPLCVVREVLLPEVPKDRSTRYSASLRAPGVDWHDQPDVPRSHTARLALPVHSGGATTLTITYKPTDAPEKRGQRHGVSHLATFEAKWVTGVPPPQVEVYATSIVFDWEVPCEYPVEDACPDVLLPASGANEKGTRLLVDGVDICRYRVGSTGQPLNMPTQVIFNQEGLTSWDGLVHAPGQRIVARQDVESTQFYVRMPWHDVARTSGDEIDYVELLAPNGGRRLVKPEQHVPVVLPFASCHDRISYRLHGNRDYDWGTVPIDSGSFALEPPGETAVVASLGLQLGAGFLNGIGWTDSRPAATAELSVRIRPVRTSRNSLFGSEFEAGLAYVLATKSYHPLHTTDFAASHELNSVAYNRFILAGYWMLPAVDVLYVGPGLGGGLGYPLFARDESKAGGLTGIVTVGGRIRYHVSRRVAVVGNFRVLYPDALITHQSSDFRGTPSEKQQNFGLLFLDLGVQGWL